MRTIEIPEITKEDFDIINNEILNKIPWSLVNQNYNSDANKGVWNFWDSDYIPPLLQKYIIRPPNHEKLINELNIFLGTAEALLSIRIS